MSQLLKKRPKGRSSVIVSVKSYKQDQMQFGVPIRNRCSAGSTGSINQQALDINMDTVFEYVSDNESGRNSDAQRTSAYQQAAQNSSSNPFDQASLSNCSSVSSRNGKVGKEGKAKKLWKQYKYRLVLGVLLLCCTGFVAYDVWLTRNGAGELEASSAPPVLAARTNFFQTDPDLIQKHSEERRRKETEEQLKLQNLAKESEMPAKRTIRLTQVSSTEIAEPNHLEMESNSLDSGQRLAEQQGHPQQCTYVGIFASAGDSQSLTYDSNHVFCDIEDIDPESRCCAGEKRVERNVTDQCNTNSQCCESMPDCVAHCSMLRFEQEKADVESSPSRDTFSECEQECRISSKSINHNRYFNDPERKYCHGQPDPSLMKSVIARTDESCDAACARQSSPTSTTYECSPQGLHMLNSCDALRKEFGCNICNKDFAMFGPAVKTGQSAYSLIMADALADSRRKLDNVSACTIASHSMLLNCDNHDPDYQRLCSCIPTN